MEDATRHALIQELGDAMGDLQEAGFRASWMCVTPTIVGLCRKALRTGQPQRWGWGELSVANAQRMWELAGRVGGWAEPDWDGDADRYVIDYPFTDLDSPGLAGEEVDW